MIDRYIQLRDILSKLESDGIDSLCLTLADNWKVDASLQKLLPLESVTKML